MCEQDVSIRGRINGWEGLNNLSIEYMIDNSMTLSLTYLQHPTKVRHNCFSSSILPYTQVTGHQQQYFELSQLIVPLQHTMSGNTTKRKSMKIKVKVRIVDPWEYNYMVTT